MIEKSDGGVKIVNLREGLEMSSEELELILNRRDRMLHPIAKREAMRIVELNWNTRRLTSISYSEERC